MPGQRVSARFSSDIKQKNEASLENGGCENTKKSISWAFFKRAKSHNTAPKSLNAFYHRAKLKTKKRE
ncbi:hypothetical protein F7725_008595, partial [Dissostichus mawsoni]